MTENKPGRDDKLRDKNSRIDDEEFESSPENPQVLSKSHHSSQKKDTSSKILPEDIEGEDIHEGKRTLP